MSSDGNDIDINALKEQLLARQKELLALLGDNADNSKPVELDQQSVGRLSRMDAMQSQAMVQETLRRRESELHRIEQALKRIESDDYGYCAQCDEEISVKRLELDPSVATCIHCAGG